MKHQGFTLIEFMILLAIGSIVLSIIMAPAKPRQSEMPSMSDNAPTRQSSGNANCIEGYKFVGGRQLLDDQGRGVRCN